MPHEKIIITGITGFGGSHLADKVLEFWENPEIYGFKRASSSMMNIEHIKDKINLIDVDFFDKDNITKIISEIEPTKIFHLAAVTYIPYSFANPQDVMNFNTIGTINLLEATRLASPDAKFHLCSTSGVYGTSITDIINENTRISPEDPYAISKATSDLFGHYYYNNFGTKVIITRTFSYTGPRKREEFAESSFAKQLAMIEKGKKEPIIKVGNLSSIKIFMDVRDLAEAYCMLMEKGIPGKTYVICGDTMLSMKEVLEKLIKMSGVEVTIDTDTELFRPTDTISRKPDSSKIRKELGWKPKIPIEKSLKDLLDYWRERI